MEVPRLIYGLMEEMEPTPSAAIFDFCDLKIYHFHEILPKPVHIQYLIIGSILKSGTLKKILILRPSCLDENFCTILIGGGGVGTGT